MVNAGDGTHEHPTQALLDAFTMRRHLGELEGRRITIVGDVLHSRVARVNVLLLATLGAEVTLVAPPTLLPVGIEAWPCATSYDLDAGAAEERRGDDAAGPARADERRRSSPAPASTAAATGWTSTGWRSCRTTPSCMHPGPMNRGMEISADVADSTRSVIVEQVTNGVAVRMAVLYLLLSGEATDARSRRMTGYLITGAKILGGDEPPTCCSTTARSSPSATAWRRRRERSTRRAWSRCPAWSTCTPTCASPAGRTPRRC